MDNFFVIYGASEKGFWSNSLGWTCYAAATHFSPEERKKLNLPIGGIWLEIEE